MDKTYPSGLMWFRRDLRAHDNAALHHALRACARVHCVFVFDRDILDPLPRADRRVEFIRESLVELDQTLRELSCKAQAGLIVVHGHAAISLPLLAAELGVQAVFTNHDYEPQANARDTRVRGALANHGVAFHSYKDHVVLEGDELLTQTGRPYGVYTPYRNAWMARVERSPLLQPHPVQTHAAALAERPDALRGTVPTLADIGFEPTNLGRLSLPPGARGGESLLADFLHRIERYHEARDFPAVKGPSYLSVHLRFGTVSVRDLAARALALAQQGNKGASTWLNELIWREFYMQVLANFPHVVDGQGRSHSFRREFDAIHWEHGKHADALFAAWCEGRTGYPLVDAAMRQLSQTGYMHNRLRMVVASFLTKDLGLDWRRGEAWFAQHLNDFELASNNGGWQWAASSGCDAQPWFRIFNPVTQSEKFDAEGRFIARYLPELAGLSPAARHAPWLASPVELAGAGLEIGRNWPAPVVDHAHARERTLARYAVVKKPKD